MKTKKGSSWLTEETAKTILALAVIFFLVVLVFKFAAIFKGKNEYEQAKATVTELSELINKINTPTVFLIEGPITWTLTSGFQNDKQLCMCKGLPKGIMTSEKFENFCLKNGVCMATKKEFKILTQNYDGKIDLETALKEIYLFKKDSTIYISDKKADDIKYYSLIEILDKFLNSEIIIVNLETKEKRKIYEQMIEIIEGRTEKQIENIETTNGIINDMNALFGKSTWCLEYSKVKSNLETYGVYTVNTNACVSHKIIQPASLIEKEIPYENGVLKTRLTILE